MSDMFTGYAIDQERRDDVLATAIPAETFLASHRDAPLPEEVSIDWQKIENQANMNSCGGHAMVCCAETLHYNHNRADVFEYSRMYAYLTAKQRSGIRGDNGVTIYGAQQAATLDGFVPESMFPYPSSYSSHIPDGLEAVGRENRVLETFRIESNQSAIEFIARGGAIIGGIPWKQSFAGERDEYLTEVSGRTYGGHAIAFCSYKMADNGERWVELTNSHGTRWAKAGRSLVHPQVFEWMINNGTLVGFKGFKSSNEAIDFTKPEFHPFGE